MENFVVETIGSQVAIFFSEFVARFVEGPLNVVNVTTVELRYKEGPRDWQKMFAITWFRYIEVLFHSFYYCWGEDYRLFYR